ncbi:MAG: hypothetical protein ACYDCB_10120, partial [Candidatus Dormibacteria bacterium]
MRWCSESCGFEGSHGLGDLVEGQAFAPEFQRRSLAHPGRFAVPNFKQLEFMGNADREFPVLRLPGPASKFLGLPSERSG